MAEKRVLGVVELKVQSEHIHRAFLVRIELLLAARSIDLHHATFSR